jgi:hypothetical protein
MAVDALVVISAFQARPSIGFGFYGNAVAGSAFGRRCGVQTVVVASIAQGGHPVMGMAGQFIFLNPLI